MEDSMAEETLASFRRQMLSFGPFVYIPLTTTAREIQKSKPFLWLGIVSCTSPSARQAFAVADRMRKILANKIVLSSERNVDLLHGLLVLLNWAQCQRKERPYLMTWTNLAITLAQDLGYANVKGETAFAYSKRFWGNVRLQPPKVWTYEDRRAALALYVWHVM